MKLSFKTTTLIAAIGLSIAVGYYLAEEFMYDILHIDLYVHPIRMHALWYLRACVWWASGIIFFWGMFRYPDQLPKPGKWSKVICYAVLASVAILFVDRSFIDSYSDPQWLKDLLFVLRFMTHCSYLAAIWWCYAKSDNGKTQVVVRYISVGTAILCSMTLFFEIFAAVAWLKGYAYMRFAPVVSIEYCYNLLYAGVAACILISLFIQSPTPQITSVPKVQVKAKRLYIAGWILVGLFACCAVFVSTMIIESHFSDWIFVLAIAVMFIAPLIAGIYLIIASKTLQDTCHIIETQADKTCAEE